MGLKKPSLAMQELPLHSLLDKKPHQIMVIEGDESSETSKDVDFCDSGGGISVMLENSIRNVCWRTSKNTLEIFEYSLDVDLYASSYVITFEGSKVLPWVHLSFFNERLHIGCCTLHALHYIVLEMPKVGKSVPSSGTPQPSLLVNLPQFDFQDSARNCYYDERHRQGNMIAWAANSVVSELSDDDDYFAAAILTSQGNMNLIQITNDNINVSHVNQASRISRVFAGINPWGDVGGPETIVDFKMVAGNDEAFIVAVCKDKKLRIWSFESHDLVFNHDLSPQINDPDDISDFEEYRIRYCPLSQVLAVFVSVGDLALFMQFKVKFQSHCRISVFETYSTTSAATVRNGIHAHLVDFTYACNTITAIWRDAEENDFISICQSDLGEWHNVAMHPQPSPEVTLLPQKDIRESFMDHIFAPGRFSPVAMLRTLSMHPGVSTSSLISDLKDRMATVIQNEIWNMMPEEGANDDALQVTAWNNLYQELIQYQQVVSRTIGISTVQGHDQYNASVVKKASLHVLAPSSALESSPSGCDDCLLQDILSVEKCSGNNLTDVKNLLLNLQNLRRHLGDAFMTSLLHNICVSGHSPCDIILDVTPDIISAGVDKPGKFMEGVVDLNMAIGILLDCLEPMDCGSDMDIPDVQSWPAGTQGTEMISQCVLKHFENRLELSTLILIMLSIFRKLQQERNPLEEDNNLISRAQGYIEVYKSLSEISSAMAQSISQGALETKLQTLSLSESFTANFNPEQARKRIASSCGNNTILEYFISGEGGKLLKGLLLAQDCNGQLLQNHMVRSCVNILVYLLWPWGPTLTLPDFMLHHCQFAALQKFLQKSAQWCDWCPKSKQYMLAYCHLHAGNFSKAVRSFISASSGIIEEEYMASKLLNEAEDKLSQIALKIIYYTKVLPIFERLDLPEQVLALAQQAIECTPMQNHDPNLPVLWSSVFRQSNMLARHNDALKAIMLNPDHHHKKDCLRTFAVSLCDRKEYKTLVELQYGELEDDLVDILQHRSRGTDISLPEHQYYDLLYAFHVQRGNFRKAASAMYEQGYQIGQGLSKSKGISDCLRRKGNCLAACINCLYLVDENNRWILHPLENSGTATKFQLPKSGSRNNNFETSAAKASKVIIHELEDVEKELKLVEMKVKLVDVSDDFPPSSLGSLISATEISSFLCHAGLYDDAISLCTTFGISTAHIFESLASKAVRLSFADDKSSMESWEWLQQNETVKKCCIGGQSSYGNWSAADVAYRLLQVYLERYGRLPGRSTANFQSTAKVLLGFNATLPAWFVSAYKLYNYPELLRLLVCYDRLDEATSLAIEMIEFAQGKLTSQFDTDPSRRKSACLPYTIIEQLLCILHSSYELADLYQLLRVSFDDYLDDVKAISDKVIEVRMQSVVV